MIVMSPYKFVESHRQTVDKFYDEARKKAGLAKRKIPLPKYKTVGAITFGPEDVGDFEKKLKNMFEACMKNVTDEGKTTVYDEVVLWPGYDMNHVRYWVTIDVRYE